MKYVMQKILAPLYLNHFQNNCLSCIEDYISFHCPSFQCFLSIWRITYTSGLHTTTSNNNY